MSESLELTGVVISMAPYQEFDKRLTILTRERGKITAFVRGARRPGSPMLASADVLVFGHFTVREGRNAYSLLSIRPVDFFADLRFKQPGIYYGLYFLELASYFVQEGDPGKEIVDLIYVALKAILKEQMPLELIRRVYEIRLLKENGLYAPPENESGMDKDAYYALYHTVSSPMGKLFSFNLSDQAFKDYLKEAKRYIRTFVDKPLNSLLFIDEA
ncbi:MAG: DNA repair protein RecO [Lachnospiraceae bacterium]|nr:DNA repair protein RecO [Candidatus Equihabitans merdae]